MDTNLKQQKVEMWSKKLLQLDQELKDIFVRKGEAARDGDLSENAAYKAAIEDAEAWQARINDVKKILTDLGVDPEKLLSTKDSGKV
jgi:transcription elongation GreA/GreB family factor